MVQRRGLSAGLARVCGEWWQCTHLHKRILHGDDGVGVARGSRQGFKHMAKLVLHVWLKLADSVLEALTNPGFHGRPLSSEDVLCGLLVQDAQNRCSELFVLVCTLQLHQSRFAVRDEKLLARFRPSHGTFLDERVEGEVRIGAGRRCTEGFQQSGEHAWFLEEGEGLHPGEALQGWRGLACVPHARGSGRGLSAVSLGSPRWRE